MKKGIAVIFVLTLGMGAYFAGAKLFSPKQKEYKMIPSQISSENKNEMPVGEPTLSGRIVSISGNEFKIAKRPEGVVQGSRATDDEREARRVQFETMTEEQRQEMRAQRQQANVQPSEEISITISNDAAIIKIDDEKTQKVSIKELENGKNISIWKNDKGDITHVIQQDFNFQRTQEIKK